MSYIRSVMGKLQKKCDGPAVFSLICSFLDLGSKPGRVLFNNKFSLFIFYTYFPL